MRSIVINYNAKGIWSIHADGNVSDARVLEILGKAVKFWPKRFRPSKKSS